jgi:hypothetical protein
MLEQEREILLKAFKEAGEEWITTFSTTTYARVFHSSDICTDLQLVHCDLRHTKSAD